MTNYYPPSSIGPTDVGPYRLVRMIGEGGMGAVYYALRRSDNLAVALKILPRSLAMDNDQLARFRREAAVAMGLDHPNVVGCIDVDQSDGYNFMVMEFVGGGDAEELLRRSGGRISERRAMSISLDITKALHHASSFGLVHRDIKPENLLFTESGMAKLTDFGLVKRTAENLRITERGKAMGTPHFMAPEQARGKRDLDVRSDIYSLGATIYYLLSGLTPYNGNSAFEIVSQLASEPPPPLSGHRPDLSPSCLFIIECMMARELEDRPQSAKDLLVMIEAYFNGRQIPHPRDLTKPEKGNDTPTEGRKGEQHNPMKKLKAAEFQSTPGSRAPQAGEIPTNTITRHFMTSPTRIMTKGGAAPPPPSPETVSMPTAGMKVPLIKQNESRRAGSLGPPSGELSPAARGVGPPPAAAPPPQPGALRGANGPLPSPPRVDPLAANGYPPQGLPMGIPLDQPYPTPGGYPPQAYPPANESGEQITADAEGNMTPAQYPLTPPGGVPTNLPPLPRAGRADTAFVRRSPPEQSPYESGELLAEEPPSVPALPPEPTPPPVAMTPGPVTARFRIQAPPPEAYLEPGQNPPVDEAETPPPEAYIEDPSPATPGQLLPSEAIPTAAPAAAGSGSDNPVVTSQPQQPSLDTPPEVIERIALKASSSIRPAVVEEPPPDTGAPTEAEAVTGSGEAAEVAAKSEAPTDTAAEVGTEHEFTPAAALVLPAAAAVADAPAAATDSAPADSPAPETPVAEPPPAENPLDSIAPALATAPENELLAAASPPATDLAAAAGTAAAATAATPAAEALDAAPESPLPPTFAEAPAATPTDGAASESPAMTPVAAVAPAAAAPFTATDEPADTAATAEAQAATPGAEAALVAPADDTTAVSPATANAGWSAENFSTPRSAEPPQPGLQPGSMGVGEPLSGLAPAATAAALALPAVEAPAAAAAPGQEVDSLLARVRRLQSADTMSREVPPSLAPSAAPAEEAPASDSGAWKYLALGFIGGVLITLALVLLLR